MKRIIAITLIAALSISVLSGCGESTAISSGTDSTQTTFTTGGESIIIPIDSNTKKTQATTEQSNVQTQQTNNSTNNNKNTTTKTAPRTTRATQPAIKNNPKYISCQVLKFKKTSAVSFPKATPLSVEYNKNYNIISTATTSEYKEYVEKGEGIVLKLCIENPEKDTILDVLLNDSQEGENCLYSSSASKFNIKNIDTIWDKTKATYFTYVTLNIPSCTASGVRSLQILEINFLRKVINETINGTVVMAAPQSDTNFNIMCVKASGSVEIKDVKPKTNSIELSLNVKDVDKSINNLSVKLYSNNNLIQSKSNITDYNSIVFSSLDYITKYKLIVEWSYNKNDGQDSRTESTTIDTYTTLKGSGTESDPFQVWTLKEYQKFAKENSSPDYHYKLMQDIDCSTSDNAGIYSLPMSGVFDGNHKTISNFYFKGTIKTNTTTEVVYFGLFGMMNGTIKNLTLLNFYADLSVDSQTIFCGSLVGGGNANLDTMVAIDNCHAQGSITVKYTGSYQKPEIRVGEIGGRIFPLNVKTIINSTSSVTLSGDVINKN